MQSDDWRTHLAEMVPAYGMRLSEHPADFRTLRAKAHALLHLELTEKE